MDADESLRLARSAKRIVATKGLGTVRLEVSKSSEAQLLSAILGPTGRLRAPTIRVGGVLLIGFREELYREVLGA